VLLKLLEEQPFGSKPNKSQTPISQRGGTVMVVSTLRMFAGVQVQINPSWDCYERWYDMERDALVIQVCIGTEHGGEGVFFDILDHRQGVVEAFYAWKLVPDYESGIKWDAQDSFYRVFQNLADISVLRVNGIVEMHLRDTSTPFRNYLFTGQSLAKGLDWSHSLLEYKASWSWTMQHNYSRSVYDAFMLVITDNQHPVRIFSNFGIRQTTIDLTLNERIVEKLLVTDDSKRYG
jgi:hypothetical protein